MRLETFKFVGSLHILPHISISYDGKISENCVSIGWLWWGVSIVKEDEMHLP